MLDFIGTVAGNILSLPGILGLALGLMTRNLAIAAVLGGFVGIFEALTFADFSFAKAGTLEVAVSVAVGVASGLLGSAIRRKGTTV